MKILAFDSDLSKIERVSRKLAESGSLAVSSSSRGNIEITHSDAQKELLWRLLQSVSTSICRM